ncbi:MAG: hypothetical protein OXU62_12690 [Gammaproteobacteria bacterium]|nr:hypothetical protein [Gammaproteobacteria bacterium]
MGGVVGVVAGGAGGEGFECVKYRNIGVVNSGGAGTGIGTVNSAVAGINAVNSGSAGAGIGAGIRRSSSAHEKPHHSHRPSR